MGSIGAMQQGSADRYFQEGEASTAGSIGGAKLVPEGIEGQVPYKGSVVGIVFQMAGGLRAVDALLRLRQHRRDARARRSSSRSPRRAFARATSTTCRSRRKRRTTAPNDERATDPRTAGDAGRRQAAMPFIMITVLIDMVVDRPDHAGAAGARRHLHGVADRAGVLVRRRRRSPSASPTSSASPILGALSDRFGRRPVLLIGFCGLALSFFVTGAGDRALDADRRAPVQRRDAVERVGRQRLRRRHHAARGPRQALRHARRDVRPRLHPRAGDGRAARRDRPAPAVLRRRRSWRCSTGCTASSCCPNRCRPSSAGRSWLRERSTRSPRCASSAGSGRRPAGRGGRLHRACRSSCSTPPGCSTRPSSSAGGRSRTAGRCSPSAACRRWCRACCSAAC